MSDLKMREEFEAAVLRDWPSANLNICDVPFSLRAGQYVDECVQRAWWGWQASRAAVVIELPDPEIKDRPTCVEVAMDCCKEAIEAAGLQVKR